MNLEKSVRFHFPKSSRITDETPSTSEDTLKTSDVMAALGMAQAEAGFGMSAFFGKIGVSLNDKSAAVSELMKVARRRMIKTKGFNELSGHRRGRVIYLMSLFAYEDYCRTADSPETRCKYCKGRGVVLDLVETERLNVRCVKPCSRCGGLGYKRLPASHLHRAIKAVVPDLSQPTFSRYYKPVFEELIELCFKAESQAEHVLKKMTGKE